MSNIFNFVTLKKSHITDYLFKTNYYYNTESKVVLNRYNLEFYKKNLTYMVQRTTKGYLGDGKEVSVLHW